MRGGGENFKKVIDEMATPVFIFLIELWPI
jgi:hypothetical protein